MAITRRRTSSGALWTTRQRTSRRLRSGQRHARCTTAPYTFLLSTVSVCPFFLSPILSQMLTFICQDMPNRNDFLARFGALDTLIERYHRQLAAIRNRSPDDMHELLVARTFTCAAAIQLHSTFSSHQQMSWQKVVCVAVAAGRALDIVNINQVSPVDPVLAVSLSHWL